MKVLFVCSECSLFVKTGGLADVLATLPSSLSKDVECSVILPYYKKIKDRNIAEFVGSTYFKFGDYDVYCGLFKIVLNNVVYYFVDNNDFFYHDYLYGENDSTRFTFFNMAVIEVFKMIGNFDLIHLHDWHSGLVPFLLKYKYFINIKTIFTIHNIQYQGIFNKDISKLFHVYNDSLEFNGNINFMKCAIVNSDIITTVSSTYRNETLTDLYGYGLQSILKSRENDYYGIINGIDNLLYSPKDNKDIYYNYADLNGKSKNKKTLCYDYNLNENMLCSMITRLCDQKGIELLLDSVSEIMNNTNVNLFLIGSGDKFYEEKLNYYANLFPERIKVYIGYSESLAQRVYASSDLLFVPSKFEPCGLSQLIAMRYGTLPLVRETGGLKDTVEAFNKYTNTGCGFSFSDFNTSSFKEVFYIAYESFRNKDVWNMLVNNAMNKDFSFDVSAKKYLEIYRGNKL